MFLMINDFTMWRGIRFVLIKTRGPVTWLGIQARFEHTHDRLTILPYWPWLFAIL